MEVIPHAVFHQQVVVGQRDVHFPQVLCQLQVLALVERLDAQAQVAQLLHVDVVEEELAVVDRVPRVLHRL